MKIKYIFPLLLVLFAFACKNELTIFEQINEETKLEDAIITGVVNSVVKFNSKLYASDGNLYTKNENDVRGWSKIGSPSGTIIKLAADSTNLYALNEDKVLYTSTNADSWTQVDTTSMGTIQTIFWDGASAPTAYVKATSGSFYKLASSTTPTAASDIISDVLLKTDKGTYTAKDSTVTASNDLGSVSNLGSANLLYHSENDNAIYVFIDTGGYKLPLDSAGKLSTKEELPKKTEITTDKGTYTAKDGVVTGKAQVEDSSNTTNQESSSVPAQDQTQSSATSTPEADSSNNADLGTVSGLGTVHILYHSPADNIIYVFTDTGGYILPLDSTGKLSTKEELPQKTEINTDKGTYTAKGGAVTGSNNLGSVPDLGTVWSLTHSQVDNAIYAGTSKGLKKLPLDEAGKLSGKSQDPPGNWGATIKAYKAFAVLATGTNTSDAALYTSTIEEGSAYAKINGLWGYYYSRRDNWNRE